MLLVLCDLLLRDEMTTFMGGLEGLEGTWSKARLSDRIGIYVYPHVEPMGFGSVSLDATKDEIEAKMRSMVEDIKEALESRLKSEFEEFKKSKHEVTESVRAIVKEEISKLGYGFKATP